jgi:CheY-like chemotaxis protein
MAVLLVIDDDASMRRLILRTLADSNHQLIEAENGQQA